MICNLFCVSLPPSLGSIPSIRASAFCTPADCELQLGARWIGTVGPMPLCVGKTIMIRVVQTQYTRNITNTVLASVVAVSTRSYTSVSSTRFTPQAIRHSPTTLNLINRRTIMSATANASGSSSPYTPPTVPPLTLTPGKTRLGWIGTGVMGSSMAGHILTKLGSQYTMTVYNRTEAKTEPLRLAGAKVAKSIEEVVRNIV